MNDAESAIRDLESYGVSRSDISVMAAEEARAASGYTEGERSTAGRSAAKGAGAGAAVGGGLGLLAGLTSLAIPGFGPIIAAGPIAAALTGAGIGAATGGVIGALAGMGVPDEEAELYAEGVRRGGVLVAVKTEDRSADDVADILERHNPEDVDKRSEEWRAAGWTGGERRRTEATGSTREKTGREEHKIPVVEEQLNVGKREVVRAGARVYRHVSERPVEQSVNLREERIDVERRPANRPAGGVPADTFRENTIELTETAEEPVVSKEARVVEDVVVRKTADSRQETVRDTVRRSDVEVQRMAAGSSRGYSEFDNDWRTDFNSRYANRGYSYDEYEPAYRFGSTWGQDERYRNRDWNTVETDARRDWESQGARGKWEDVKDAVRYGWDRVRSRR
jgi:stress response protein YsnF